MTKQLSHYAPDGLNWNKDNFHHQCKPNDIENHIINSTQIVYFNEIFDLLIGLANCLANCGLFFFFLKFHFVVKFFQL